MAVGISPVRKQSIGVKPARRETFTSIQSGEAFSPAHCGPFKEFPWLQRWFKLQIPVAKAGEKGRRHLDWLAHGESTIYIDDKPWAGLDCCHETAVLPDKACTLYVDCGLWQTGIWGRGTPPTEDGFIFRHARLAVRNQMAWDIYHDLEVLSNILQKFFQKENIQPVNGPGYAAPLEKVNPIFRKLNRALQDVCDAYDQFGLVECSAVLKKIYKKFKSDRLLGSATYVGHAHIDLVWLWPEHASYKKGIHTFATQLRLMEQYPEYTFTMSQPPLLYHIKEHEPAQAKEIEQRIKEGRWEFTGGFEVEADTQIPVGEGLARSLIYGQERIEAVRGSKSNTVWVPDVFGYSQCLPQMFSLAGIDNFYTTKILWTTISKFPHNSFTWKSPDGSEVLTHLAVAGCNCNINPSESIDAIEEYRQSDVHDELLNAAGYGDGGGGATEGHCERLKRMADLSGLPQSSWSTVEPFFKRLKKVQKDLPTYRGELYLEYHRGVQTSQSNFKFNMRACERSLQTREAMRVIAGGKPLADTEWLRYLFMHFHDAVPGSSIHSVYEQLNEEMEGIVAHNAFETEREWRKGKPTTKNNAQDICVVNPLMVSRHALLDIAKGPSSHHLADADTVIIPTQETAEGVIAAIDLNCLESKTLSWQPRELPLVSQAPLVPQLSPLKATTQSLSNGIVDAQFNSGGALIELSINGTAIALTAAAGLYLHHDRPAQYEAWDIDHSAMWTAKAVCRSLSLEVIERGPVRAILRGKSPFGKKSSLEIDYILEVDACELKVECRVDWHEDNTLLRYRLDTDYRGSIARYGAPFGSTDRSQLEGLPAQEAQWEVPASRWASVMDGRHNGLSIITEAKYGFSAKEGVLTVSLLRAPSYPDPVCDRGQHRIRFAIALHQDETTGTCLSTAARADALYTPVLCVNDARAQAAPFHFENLGTVVPAWCMPARTHTGYIIRMHECAGGEQSIDLHLRQAVKKVQLVDFFEKKIGSVKKISATHYRICVAAHKIISVSVEDE